MLRRMVGLLSFLGVILMDREHYPVQGGCLFGRQTVAPDVVAQHVLSRLKDCEGDFPVAEAEQICRAH